ncbi:MAG: patatin-like phospholipase family protein [Alteromonadaceae bacterium]|nr:patatin-like phospholipase family protein [Alteromonadaceae bacterium]
MKTVSLSLALQGGGAHGAFTWGVLNRLLNESWIKIEGISGASAGAMNAVMLAEGWRKNGAEGARQSLADFWYDVAAQDVGFEIPGEMKSSVTKWWQGAFQYLSPYDVNLFDVNPLRDIIPKHVDFSKLQHANSPIRLFIAATEVSTGKLILFENKELTTDHLLASACLPHVYKAIEINQKHYWDGGYSGNPAIFPLIHECQSKDIMIVLLQPLQREALPTSKDDIDDRITEIGFHSHFMREMHAIATIRKVIGNRRWLLGKIEKRIKQLRTHLLTNGDLLASLSSETKFDNRKRFLDSLREAGEDSADQWLQQHADNLGKSSSCHVEALFK